MLMSEENVLCEMAVSNFETRRPSRPGNLFLNCGVCCFLYDTLYAGVLCVTLFLEGQLVDCPLYVGGEYFIYFSIVRII
jgi:hypothetical protein